MTSPQYQKFYKQLLAKKAPKTASLAEARANFERLMSEFPPEEDIRFEPFSIGTLPASWVFAPGVPRQPIVLFFHGGGFNSGSIRSHRALLGRLSRATHAAVLAIEYRLAPENPFPAALDDAMTAYRWLIHHPYPHNHIALAGLSAGAGLALSLCLKLKLEKSPLPASCALLSPWVDFTLSLPSLDTHEGKDLVFKERLADSVKAYCSDPKNPFVSPLLGDLSGLPPLFIQTGTHELLFDDALTLSEKAKQAGVQTTLEKWPDMVHSWHLFASLFPEGKEAIENVGTFLKKAFQ